VSPKSINDSVTNLSHSATAAGDNQVRVFDIKGSLPESAVEQEAQVSTQSCISISDCHTDRAKKLVTEDSPDLFLSVGEV
jgi:WD repeat-containing protein 42A